MVEQEVLRTVREMNRLWTEGDGSGLERYFHRDMIAIAPDRKERLEGAMPAWRNGRASRAA